MSRPRMALRALKAASVPTASLIHEFSSYARPSLAFPAILALSTETVFSTRMTLEDAVANLRLDPGAYIHMAPLREKASFPPLPSWPSRRTVGQRTACAAARSEGSGGDSRGERGCRHMSISERKHVSELDPICGTTGRWI